jgi:hypothetical protein
MAEGGSLLPAPATAVEMKVFQGGGLSTDGGSLLPMPSHIAELQVYRGGGEKDIEKFLADGADRSQVKFRGLTLDELVDSLDTGAQPSASALAAPPPPFPILLIEIDKSGIPSKVQTKKFADKEIYVVSIKVNNSQFEYIHDEESLDLTKLFFYDSSDGKEFTGNAEISENKPFVLFVFSETLPKIRKDSLFVSSGQSTASVASPIGVVPPPVPGKKNIQPDNEEIEKKTVSSITAISESEESISDTDKKTSTEPESVTTQIKNLQEKLQKPEISNIQTPLLQTPLTKQKEAIAQIKAILPEDLQGIFVSKTGGEKGAGILSQYFMREKEVSQSELDQLIHYLKQVETPVSFLSHSSEGFLPTPPFFQEAYKWYLGLLTEKVLGNIAANTLRKQINGNVQTPEIKANNQPVTPLSVAPLSISSVTNTPSSEEKSEEIIEKKAETQETNQVPKKAEEVFEIIKTKMKKSDIEKLDAQRFKILDYLNKLTDKEKDALYYAFDNALVDLSTQALKLINSKSTSEQIGEILQKSVKDAVEITRWTELQIDAWKNLREWKKQKKPIIEETYLHFIQSIHNFFIDENLQIGIKESHIMNDPDDDITNFNIPDESTEEPSKLLIFSINSDTEENEFTMNNILNIILDIGIPENFTSENKSILKEQLVSIFTFIIENDESLDTTEKEEKKKELVEYLDTSVAGSNTNSSENFRGGSRKVKKHIMKTRKQKQKRSTNGVRGRVRTSRKVRSKRTN